MAPKVTRAARDQPATRVATINLHKRCHGV
jgi:hypothetical protein